MVEPTHQPGSKSFLQRLAVTGRLTSKQAYRTKLQSIDLRRAHSQIGRKAYEGGLIPPKLVETTSELDAIRDRLIRLRQPIEKPASSFGQKARAAAGTATRATKAEALRLRRRYLLQKLGRKIRDQPEADPALVDDIAAANAISDRIKTVDQEIEKLRGESWLKRPLLILSLFGIGLMAVLGVVVANNAGHPSPGAQKQAAARHTPTLQLAMMQHDQIQTGSDQQGATPTSQSPATAATTAPGQTDAAAELERARQRINGMPDIARMAEEAQRKYDQQVREYQEKQAKEKAEREEAERAKREVQENIQRQIAQKRQEAVQAQQWATNRNNAEQKPKEDEVAVKRKQLANVIVPKATIKEEAEVAPAAAAIKYAVSPHGLHVAAATLQGSRHVMLMDGVPGPQFDDFMWVEGAKFHVTSLMSHATSASEPTDVSRAPVVFSDDGGRFAYVGRQGKDYVIMVDGKEFARGPYNAEAITSVSFTPDGKHLRYIETLEIPGRYEVVRTTRLVVDGRKGPPTDNLRADEISWSADGEHHAYFTHSMEAGYHLVVDGRSDPPDLNVPGYDIAPKGQYTSCYPLFTADSAHLITLRQRKDPGIQSHGADYGILMAPAVFVDKTRVLEAPTGLRQGKRVAAEFYQVSVAPVGSNFIAVYNVPEKGHRLFFNQKQLVPDVAKVDEIVWSKDGKRYMVRCESGQSSEFMIIDGKKQPEFRSVALQSNHLSGGNSETAGFTADSAKSVYLAATDKSFLEVEDAESDGYKAIHDLTFSRQGGHIAFIATDDTDQKMLVVDGKPSEPRADIHKFMFTPDGTHYAFLSNEKDFGNRIVIDGVPQQNRWSSDFVHYTSSSREDDRQFLFSPDGRHFAYLSATPDFVLGVCLDGKLLPVRREKLDVRPFFSPDSKHFIWIDWGSKLTPMGGGSSYNFADVPGYAIYVDGQLAGSFECPTVKTADSKSVAGLFQKTESAAEMGGDGVLTMLGQAGNAVKKLSVIPSADSNLAMFEAAIQQHTVASEETKKEPAASNW